MRRVQLTVARRQVDAGRRWWDASLYGNSFRRMRELDLDTHALALCAQQVLCTAPLIVAVSAVLQRTEGRSVSYFMARFFGLRGTAATDLERLFGSSAPSISTAELVFAAVTAIIFSTSVAAVQQRAFEMIWLVPRVSGIRSYLRQLVWAFALGLFSFGVLFAGRAGRAIGHHTWAGVWSAVVLQGVLTFLFYWWSQRWLLGGRVGWRLLRPGALLVGGGTIVLVRLTRVIIPEQITWQVHAYGLVGAVFVLSVWLMILSGVIFGGVLIGALVVQRRPTRVADTATVVEVSVDEPVDGPITVAEILTDAVPDAVPSG